MKEQASDVQRFERLLDDEVKENMHLKRRLESNEQVMRV